MKKGINENGIEQGKRKQEERRTKEWKEKNNASHTLEEQARHELEEKGQRKKRKIKN